MNIYDVRLLDSYPACGMNWPIDLVNITTYLGVSPPPPSSFPLNHT